MRRALPGLNPDPVGYRHCWVTRLPWSDDGLAVWDHQGAVFVAGHDLFKHAPALGRALARLMRSASAAYLAVSAIEAQAGPYEFAFALPLGVTVADDRQRRNDHGDLRARPSGPGDTLGWTCTPSATSPAIRTIHGFTAATSPFGSAASIGPGFHCGVDEVQAAKLAVVIQRSGPKRRKSAA